MLSMPVQRIEDAEDVDALRVRLADELRDHVVGIGRVADGVRAAQQHLEADVRNALAQFAQALPRIFVQEAHATCRTSRRPTFPG